MKCALLLLVAASAAQAQDSAAIERGARLFRARCAVPYCHGAEGTAGRAPKLIGHNLSTSALFKVITWGVPEKGMPGFTTLLKTPEIEDLVGYLSTLRGAGSGGVAARPPELPKEAKEGRGLFFDAARMGACGTCHELDGWGVPVGPELTSVPADLRRVAASRVKTARPGGGEPPFPALVVEQTKARVRVFDLSAALPVLRTFSQLTLDPGSSWRHEDATRIYTDGELEAIARYLRAVLGRR